jgi:hypothetical protein
MKPYKASHAEAAAMREFMDSIHSRANFRYPIDGQWGEFDKIFNAALDETFGPDSPNSAQNKWVRRLRSGGIDQASPTPLPIIQSPFA